jgi:site-specific DNA-methyltransferase (adenine-specific)
LRKKVIGMTERAQIICGSSESMRELADDSVTLTLTSPPYWSLVDFARFDRGASKDDCWKNSYTQQYATYPAYLAAMQRVFGEVYRATKPGGHLALQVASMQRQHRCYPIPFDLTKRLVDLGWEYREHIFWHKCRNTCQRAGVLIQNPYPGYYYPGLVGEHLLILRKPGPRLFQGVDPARKESARIPITPLVTNDVLQAVWHIPIVAPLSVQHPTVFPEELCHRVITLWSYPGDLVLDPFVGSGQTTKVARALGRACVGYEIEPGFADYARSRLDEPLRLRRKQIVVRYEHVVDDPFVGGRT